MCVCVCVCVCVRGGGVAPDTAEEEGGPERERVETHIYLQEEARVLGVQVAKLGGEGFDEEPGDRRKNNTTTKRTKKHNEKKDQQQQQHR